MKRIKSLVLAALAVLAVGAITATAAQATEGPFYKIGGTRLKAPETRGVEGSLTKEYVLTNGVQTLKATKQKLEKASIIGSTGKNAGSSSEVIVFEEATVEGNGTPCKPEKGIIKTVAVNNILDYPSATPKKGDKLLVLFKPVAGAVFTKIKFEGEGCTLKEAAVEGSVAAEIDNEAQLPIKVEENETEGTTGLVIFPETLIKVDFIEEEGAFKEVKTGLTTFGKKATKFTGHSVLNLEGKPKWGVFTK